MVGQTSDRQCLVSWWSKLAHRVLCEQSAGRRDLKKEMDDGQGQRNTSGPQGGHLRPAIDDDTGPQQHRVDRASA